MTRFWVALVAGIVAGGTAHAQVIQLVEPQSGVLSFDHVPFDVASPSQRIRIRNASTGSASGSVHVSGEPGLVITASGGSLGPGEEAYWDIACVPDAPEGTGGAFDFDWCGETCGDASGLLTVYLLCTPGSLAPPAPTITMPVVYAYDASQLTVPWTNVGADPVTVTSFSFANSAFTAVVTGGLPQTVLPGDRLTTLVTFDTTRGDTTARFDIMTGTLVVGRATAAGVTLKQLQPNYFAFDAVPQGAVYTLPIRVRNSSPVTRTIASLTSDASEIATEGLVGKTLQPGATARGLLSFTATTLGSRVGNVTLAFDTGNGDTGQYWASVVAPSFEVVTADQVPTDGRLDFGTWRIDAPPVDKTFTIINHTAVARPVLGCMPAGGPSPQFAFVGACPTSIPANGSTDFTIRLTPNTVGDAVEGVGVPLGVPYQFAVQLDARIVDHQLALSVPQLAFDAVRGDSAQQTITITNVASNAITVPVAISGTGFAVVGPATMLLDARASADITVAFTPPSPGSYTGTLELGTAGDRDHVEVPLVGNGSTPMVTCDPALEFGDVSLGSTAELMLAVHNRDATRTFRIDHLVIDDPSFTVTEPADPALGPGATISIPVQFTPATDGEHTGQLSVMLVGDATPIAVVELTGTGLAGNNGGGCCDAGGSPGGPMLFGLLVFVSASRRRARRARRDRGRRGRAR